MPRVARPRGYTRLCVWLIFTYLGIACNPTRAAQDWDPQLPGVAHTRPCDASLGGLMSIHLLHLADSQLEAKLKPPENDRSK
eukprot:1028954-Pleurochrysis_carterae.AAC.2